MINLSDTKVQKKSLKCKEKEHYFVIFFGISLIYSYLRRQKTKTQ